MFFFSGSDRTDTNFQNQDLFLFDKSKFIHIATAGMDLTEFDLDFNHLLNIKDNFSTAMRYRRSFNILISNNLERNNLITRVSEDTIHNALEIYTSFFTLMAKRGFYSYDKVNINDPYDYTFELIAHPIYKNHIIKYNNFYLNTEEREKDGRLYDYSNLSLIETTSVLPDTFTKFDLKTYL